ncbi:MAG: TonB family protein [Burkholderiales bacterium]|nr:TonB family protein [Burkholderiales bacterium]
MIGSPHGLRVRRMCMPLLAAALLPAVAIAQPSAPAAGPPAASSAPRTAAPEPSAPAAVPAEAPVMALQHWRQRMRDAIQQHMTPPASIPLDAQVELEVSLLPSGLAADVTTHRASGYPDLDASLRRAVLVATPLPLPGDQASYERLRRFSVLYEVRSGVRVVDAHPAPTELQRQAAFSCRAHGVAAAPACAAQGSRTDLLTCYAQAVRARAVATALACGPAVYPLETRRTRLEGTVQVGISFEGSGRLGAVTVAHSSGHHLLDQRALELVRESMLPPPPELVATPFVVQVPVVFQMQRSDGSATTDAATDAPAAAAAAPDAAPARAQAAPAKATPAKAKAKPNSATKKKPVKKKKKKSPSRKRRV